MTSVVLNSVKHNLFHLNIYFTLNSYRNNLWIIITDLNNDKYLPIIPTEQCEKGKCFIVKNLKIHWDTISNLRIRNTDLNILYKYLPIITTEQGEKGKCYRVKIRI